MFIPHRVKPFQPTVHRCPIPLRDDEIHRLQQCLQAVFDGPGAILHQRDQLSAQGKEGGFSIGQGFRCAVVLQDDQVHGRLPREDDAGGLLAA